MVKGNINVFQTFLKLRGVITFESQMITHTVKGTSNYAYQYKVSKPYNWFLNFKPVVSEPLIQKS